MLGIECVRRIGQWRKLEQKHANAHEQPWCESHGRIAFKEGTTPAPSLTTAVFRVGDRDSSANWVMEEQRTKTRPRSPAALARVARPWVSHPDSPIPAPSLTTGVFRVGDSLCYRLGNGALTGTFPPTLTSSLGSSRTAALSERDFDGDGTYTIFQAHSYLDTQEQSISSGGGHTCAILDNGSVSCWGEGLDGQLGNGGTINVTTPTSVATLGTNRTAVALSAGNYHTCAILDNGSVSCWGRGDNGQLGNGETSNKYTPTLTSSLGAGRTAVALSSGAAHTCALLDNGLISCWGYGDYGQLGNGGTTGTNVPTLTSSLGTGRTALALSSGQDHTCALLDNGSVSCWGDSNLGQLGNGGSYSLTPTLTGSFGTGRTAVAFFWILPHMRHSR